MQPPSNQSFQRSSDRILGGVCSGLAQGFQVEVLWVRVAFVLLAFLQGIGILLYLVLWILMPDRAGHRPPGQTAFDSMVSDVKRAWADLRAQFGGASAVAPSASVTAPPTPPPTSAEASVASEGVPAATSTSVPLQTATRHPSFILGAILIVVGIAFLAANNGFVHWAVIWPLALVALGIALLVRNLSRRP
jgi:phage shock protein PspC (stress-responsive transcriptional regulator)